MDECNAWGSAFVSMTVVDVAGKMSPSLYINLCGVWDQILGGYADWAGCLGHMLGGRPTGPVVLVAAFWPDGSSCHLIVDLCKPSEPSIAYVLAAGYNADVPIPSPADGSPIQCWTWTGIGAPSIDFGTVSYVLRQRFTVAKGCQMRAGWDYHLDMLETLANEQGYELVNDGRMIKSVLSGGN